MIDSKLFDMPQNRASAVDAIADRFRELVMQRKLKPGDLLPSEGVLAESMGVSRGSIREAMKVLTALGIVDIRRGDGTYISSGIGQTMLDPFLLRLMMNDYDRKQIIEFREMMEFDVARAVLKNKDPNKTEHMRLAVDQMASDLNHSTLQTDMQWVDLEFAFHKALGQATGNVLIDQLYGFVMKFFEPSIRETYLHPDNSRNALSLHTDILKAIESGDERETLLAVARSIQVWAEQEERP